MQKQESNILKQEIKLTSQAIKRIKAILDGEDKKNLSVSGTNDKKEANS